MEAKLSDCGFILQYVATASKRAKWWYSFKNLYLLIIGGLNDGVMMVFLSQLHFIISEEDFIYFITNTNSNLISFLFCFSPIL